MGSGLQIKPLLIRKHPVPDVPAAAESLLEQLRLFRSGVEPDLDGGIPDCVSVRNIVLFHS